MADSDAKLDYDGLLYFKNKIMAEIQKQTSALLNTVYPVGSIYMSVNTASPATLFGGTWEKLKDRFLLAAGDTYAAGAVGGEAAHTLTTDEMPSHTHQWRGYAWMKSDGVRDEDYRTPVDGNDVWSSSMLSAGGGAAHNNMPPYLAVYIWKRTA